MKNLLIYMKDKDYGKKLCNLLIKNMDDANVSIIEKLEGINQYDLILTDYIMEKEYNHLYFSHDDGINKYQSIYSIIEIINNELNFNKNINRQKKIITFVDLNNRYPENKYATKFAKDFSEKYKVLLINLNDFNKYGFNENEIGLENLIFMDVEDLDSDYKVNKYGKLDYFNSSYLNEELYQRENYCKIIDIIKKVDYDYVVIDMCLNLSKRSIQFLKISNKILLFSDKNIDPKFEYNNFKFIVKNIFSKYDLYEIKTNANSYIFKIHEHGKDTSYLDVDVFEGVYKYL